MILSDASSKYGSMTIKYPTRDHPPLHLTWSVPRVHWSNSGWGGIRLARRAQRPLLRHSLILSRVANWSVWDCTSIPLAMKGQWPWRRCYERITHWRLWMCTVVCITIRRGQKFQRISMMGRVSRSCTVVAAGAKPLHLTMETSMLHK